MSNSSIPERMQALVWVAPRQMAVQEIATPAVQADEALIRVAYAGICGSELSGYLGHNALRVPPLVMGHEFSGEIVALGDNAAQRNPALALGQQVTVNPMVYCGECYYCRQGQNQLCTNRRLIGAHRPGAFAGFISAPAWMVMPLPADLTVRNGALTEPLACGVRIGEWAGEVRGETVLVAGAGTIGLLALQVLRLNGAERVFIMDTDPSRQAIAGELGGEVLDPKTQEVVKIVRAATDGFGAALAVDAVGKAVTREQCVAATRPAGTVILSGLHEETSAMPVADVIRREITLHGSFCYTPQDFQRAGELLAKGAVQIEPWIIEEPLSRGGEWFERLSADTPGGVTKVLLTP